jgi:hypothetical protein
MNISKASGIDKVIESFVAAAKMHGAATEEGNWKKANRQYDLMATAFDQLKLHGRTEWKASFLDLLQHENEFVRCAAAARTLEFAPARAEQVLIELSQQPGVVSLDAQMILERWRAGDLTLSNDV